MVQCFEPGSVVCNLSSCDKLDTIREVIAKATVFGDPDERARIERAVIAREHMQSTGIGGGVAVAHGEVLSAPEVVIALGVSPGGIAFDSIDGQPVHLLFVFATPPNQRQEYLQALCAIVRLVKADFFRRLLTSSLSAPEMQRRLFKAFRDLSRKLTTRTQPTAQVSA